MQLAAGGPKTRPRDRVLAPTRYRHPGDVIRLIAAALVLAVAAVIAALFPALLRPAAAAITAVGPATAAGQVLTGLVQVAIAAAALVLLVAALRYRRFRVLATVAGGFAAAAALMAGITYLAGPGGSAALPAGLRQGSWLTGAGFPDPAVLAGLAAVAVAAAPWLSRPWRRAAWAHAAADRRGPADHWRAAADAAGAGAGHGGDRRGRACWWRSGCRTGGWAPPGWQRRCARAACRSAR